MCGAGAGLSAGRLALAAMPQVDAEFVGLDQVVVRRVAKGVESQNEKYSCHLH